MPGLTPIANTNTLVVHHDSAIDFLSATFPTLRRHEESANIVFAHALKLLESEAALTGCHFINESDVNSWWKQRTRTTQSTAARSRVKPNEPFWLTVWTSPTSFLPPTLDIVLACVRGSLGDYPIFLWTPKTPAPISSSWFMPRTELLAARLADIVPPQRVFSVFGMTPLVKSFTRCWSDLVKCPIELEPFYAAHYTYCNLETFKEAIHSLPSGDNIRRANVEDVVAVAKLCKEFADDSVRPSRGTLATLLAYLTVPFIGVLPT